MQFVHHKKVIDSITSWQIIEVLKIKKKCQYVTYNALFPDYKSAKNYLWKIKAHGLIFGIFWYYAYTQL